MQSGTAVALQRTRAGARSIRVLWFTVAAFAAVDGYLIFANARRYGLTLLVQFALFLPGIIYVARRERAAESVTQLPVPRLRWLIPPFLSAALLLSWYSYGGALIYDEIAYLFEAKILLEGRLAADAPPGALRPAHTTDPSYALPHDPEWVANHPGLTTVPKATFFEHHVITPDHRWFVKYPLGWPLILAGAVAAHAPWALNPLFGVVLLLLIAALTRASFGRRVLPGTVPLSVLIAVLSPYFLANSIGMMSHAAAAVAVAGATYLCLAGLRTYDLKRFAAAFALVAGVCVVRPWTGMAAGLTLGLASLWYLQSKPRLQIQVFCAGAVCGAIAALLTAATNKVYTGSYWITPYSLSRGSFRELTLGPADILQNFIGNARISVESTVVYSFPFAFLLAAYALWREREHRREVNILALLFPVLFGAYLLQTDGSGAFNGERYYFEAFFAIAVLAARGAVLLVQRHPVSNRALSCFLACAIALQLSIHAVSTRAIFVRVAPLRAVRQAAESLDGRYLVFLRDTPGFTGMFYNINEPDWPHRDRVYLIDPGPAGRAAWAKRLGRPRWAVIGYNPATGSADVQLN